ncbi:restriction endonuclease subunit S [Halocatena halophila]|uniref:restriction endonuclease subunit S n=1 Tax=Halocatena halophila TaxID=2814576 RepID=UPI002ED585BC
MSEEATLDEFVDQDDSDDEIDNWPVARVKNHIELISGVHVKSDKVHRDDSSTPYLTGPEDFDGLGFTVTKYTDEPTKYCEPEDTLVTVKGSGCGKAAFSDQRACISRQLKALRPVSTVNPHYLYQSMKSKERFLETLSEGSAIPGLSNSHLTSLDIPVPDKEEQRKIATVLHNVDKAIQKTKEIIKQTRRSRTGIVQDIFTTGYFNHEETQDVRLGPVKTSIPEDWELGSVSESFRIIDGDRGENYPSQSDFQDDGYCLFLSANNVTDRGLRFGETEFISKKKDKELRNGRLSRGDIVMTTRGTVGNFGYYDEAVDYEHIRINSGMVILRPKGEVTCPEFYYHLFRSRIFQKQISAASYGTAQPQTSVTDIKKMRVAELSDEEKRKISEVIRNINSIIEQSEQYKDYLVSIKQALMQDLLSGKVRTTDTSIAVPDEIRQHG